jgi:Asp-tRNA(Asn)/Glu-tRNA(Gln) amidotransferase A subunit family amidase
MYHINHLTATETQALLAESKTTFEQIVRDYQIRYEARDGQVRAWVCVNHVKGNGAGLILPLTGVVVAFKDDISMSISENW